MSSRPPSPCPRTHVVIIDGTLSRLEPGHETNAGLLFKLLCAARPRRDLTLRYEAGVQGAGVAKWLNVAAGIGIHLSVADGYAALSSRYRPGDRIMLFGFSRGAFAARGLAALIGRVGLLRREHATERHVAQALRHGLAPAAGPHARLFRRRYCHDGVPIELLGVWDTVKALGLPYPLISRLAPMAGDLQGERLTGNVRHAFQALALDEDRAAFAPLPWRLDGAPGAVVEQMWFPGAHGDVGGNVGARPHARPLANIPLTWMIERAERCGLALPDGWRARFPTDPGAPAKGSRVGSARLFWDRAPRLIGRCSSEAMHPSVRQRMDLVPGYRPRAEWVTPPEGVAFPLPG
jgi:uncharacterized protein (DUF2235 family)